MYPCASKWLYIIFRELWISGPHLKLTESEFLEGRPWKFLSMASRTPLCFISSTFLVVEDPLQSLLLIAFYLLTLENHTPTPTIISTITYN